MTLENVWRLYVVTLAYYRYTSTDRFLIKYPVLFEAMDDGLRSAITTVNQRINSMAPVSVPVQVSSLSNSLPLNT